MISAVFAFVPPDAPRFDATTIAVLFTFIGGACFLVGSLLMLPETALASGFKVLKNTQHDDPKA